jgi:hypothetical protein
LRTDILGYCPLTDWHFRILEKLGKTDIPGSYVKYLAKRITGLDLDTSMVDKATLYIFIVVLVLSVFLNMRDYLRTKAH